VLDMDEKELAASFQELPEIQRQEFEKNETIKGLLTSTDEKTISIRIGTVDVKIRSSLPRKIRRSLIKYQRMIEAVEDKVTLENMDEIERSLYPILSEIVVEPKELKDPNVWQYIDETEGLATTAFTMIMLKINKQGEDIKNSQKATKGK
jgi:hypothetical protein